MLPWKQPRIENQMEAAQNRKPDWGFHMECGA